MSDWTISEITSLKGMEVIAPEWRRLWERDPRATPFQSPDWLIPWTRHLWGGGWLHILEIRRQARLVAVVPLFQWGMRRERISFLGSGISDYLGMTCAPDFAAETGRRALTWIAECCGEWEVCDLQELREGDPLLEAAAPPGVAAHALPCSICPVADLPRSMDEYLARLDAPFRRSLRTAEKRLRGAGNLEIVQAGAENWSDLLGELFRLHAARWGDREQIGVERSALRPFHREVAGRFSERGLLQLFGVLVDGVCIAAQYNFTAKGRVYAYMAGFDVRWSRSSPGSVGLEAAIRSSIGEGIGEFDFLRKAEAYKYAWGARDEHTHRLLMLRGDATADEFVRGESVVLNAP